MDRGRFPCIIMALFLVLACSGQEVTLDLFTYDVCLATYNAGASSYIGEGCVYDLKHPIYTFCPANIVIAEPQAQYCGLKDHVWVDYTYRCEAYLAGADGFYDGACSCSKVVCSAGYECEMGNCVPENTCETVNCPPGFQCVEGQCEAIPEPEEQPECTLDGDCNPDETCNEGKCQIISCDNTVCGEYEDCQFGVCFRKFDYFCSRIQPQVLRHYCPISRPSEQQCPTTTFLPPFSSTYCGISYNHERHDFATGCEACKRTFVYYYYTQGCDTLPEHPDTCSTGSQCKSGQCVAIDYCHNITCPKGTYCNNGLCLPIIGFCENDGDCEAGLTCNNANLCDVYVATDPCANVVCPTGERCIGGSCFDNCYNSNCPAGTTCDSNNGYCYTIDPICTDNDQCAAGQVCLLGKCRTPITPQPPAADSCLNVLCQTGTSCVGGVCVPVDLCAGVSCPTGEKCVSGLCVDACMMVDCPAGYMCQGGECIDLCANVVCSVGQKCQGGACVLDPLTICNTIECSAGFRCELGNCVPNSYCYTNSHTECQGDAICVNTRCVVGQSCVSSANCYGAYCVDGVCRSQLP